MGDKGQTDIVFCRMMYQYCSIAAFYQDGRLSDEAVKIMLVAEYSLCFDVCV